MKKRILFAVITLIVAMLFVGCGMEYNAPDYGFDGQSGLSLELDEGMVLDGVIDETVWANCKNVNVIAGATTDEYTKKPIDESLYGQREAKVYTYIGEKAIYFAFEVKDKNLYYNKSRAQGRNNCVEVYFADGAQRTFSDGCWSVRVNPTGGEGEKSVNVGIYRPRHYKDKQGVWRDEWCTTMLSGGIAAMAKVEGTMMTSTAQTDYTTEGNVGYVIEMAIDVRLLGDDKTAVQYTAAFCQPRGFTMDRLGNTFLPNTNYLNPATWVLVNNDGVVADKLEYMDSRVVTDEGFVADGEFTESIWDGAQPRVFETPEPAKIGGTEKLTYSMYGVTTDKGVYIGVKSNDGNIYVHEGLREQFSTGAEINISANGTTMVEDQYTLQYRYNVNGNDFRRYGMKTDGTGFSYSNDKYYPVKKGGKVLGDINSSNADGWTAEIFIPWDAFPGKVKHTDRIALMLAGYRAYAEGEKASDGVTQKRGYIDAVGAAVCANGGPNMNPQEKWFKFRNGKPEYKPVAIPTVALDNSDLVSGTEQYYQTTVSAAVTDSVVTKAGYRELFEKFVGAQISFDNGVEANYVDNNDGTYLLKIAKADAHKFENGATATVTAGASTSSFSVAIDENVAIDGRVDDGLWTELNRLSTTQTTGDSTTSTSFTATLTAGAIYVSAVITDPKYSTYKDTQMLGIEMYVNIGGGALSKETTYGVRILSNESPSVGGRLYNYLGLDVSAWPWAPEFLTLKEIKCAFADNNNGTYSVEAKIPYSVFGLEGKIDSIELAPFTKFIHSASSNPSLSTRFNKWEGPTATVTKALYQRFDESGYAPNHAVIVDENNETVEEIKLVRLAANETYEGELTLSLFPTGLNLLTDLNFGENADCFTNNGNGKYSFSVSTDMFVDGVLEVRATSATYGFDGKLRFVLDEISELFVAADGYNVYTAERNGADYVFKIKVAADEAGNLPVVGAVFTGVTATDNGDGTYVIRVPQTAFSNGDVTVKVSFDGVNDVEKSFTLKYRAWTADEIAKVKSYLSFNGSKSDAMGNTVTENGTVTYADRTGSGDAVNLKNNANTLYVAEEIGAGDFSVSFDAYIFKADAANTDARYELFSSGTNVDSSSDTFQISVRSNWGSLGLRIQLGATLEYDSYTFKELDGILRLDGWNTIAVVVDRNLDNVTSGNERASMSVYVNGELIRTTYFTNIPVGTVIGNGELRLGGGRLSWNTTTTKSLKMDNFLLYGGILSAEQIADVTASTALINAN